MLEADIIEESTSMWQSPGRKRFIPMKSQPSSYNLRNRTNSNDRQLNEQQQLETSQEEDEEEEEDDDQQQQQ